MSPGMPMVIRNDGKLMLEATDELILSGTKVSVREGGKVSHPTSQDTTESTTGGSDNPLDIIDVIREAIEVAAEVLDPNPCD